MGLLQKWRNRRQAKQRQIFRFWDGQQIRGFDPMTAIRGFDDHPTFDASVHPALAMCPDPKLAGEAAAICAQAVSDVFGVKPYDGLTETGMLEGERLALLASFGRYISALKKNGETEPTTAETTTPESTPTTSATKSTLDSGSTCPDSKPDEPPAS